MDLKTLKYPKVPDPEKVSYLIYAPGTSKKFRTYPNLTQPRSAVTRKRKKCTPWIYDYYKKNFTGPFKGQYNNMLEDSCALVFESKGEEWVLKPEESLALMPIDGYPIVQHQTMYHVPIRIKPVSINTLRWNAYYKLPPAVRKKVRTEPCIWYSVKKLIDASKQA